MPAYTFVDLGTSKNQLYTLLESPEGGVNRRIPHTSVHVSTTAAANAFDAETALGKIWAEFADREVFTAHQLGSTPIPGDLMIYNHDNPGPFEPGATTEYLDMFDTGKGRCGAWSRFFVNALSLHGIAAKSVEIENEPSVQPTAPAGYTLGTDQGEKLDLIKVADGPAQGTGGANYDKTEFTDHAVVWVEIRPTQIFDPSYGKLYVGETNTLADAEISWELHNLVRSKYIFVKEGEEEPEIVEVPADPHVKQLKFIYY